jgi:hypothetical protein
MFPGAFFIHILRDGRRVVHSMINVTRRFDRQRLEAAQRTGHIPPWPEDFRSACIAWRCCVEKSLEFCMGNPTRGITVLHEQLVADPRMLAREQPGKLFQTTVPPDPAVQEPG